MAWESVSFLSFYFPISLPGKISIEFHLCDAFYRPLATVWCKMDKLIKGIGWQTHKTYLYTLEPTHKDLLPSSSFESPPSKEVTFLGWGHISRHFKVRRAFLRHRKWNDWEYRDRKCRQDKTWKLFSPVWKALFSTSYKLHNMLIGIWARSHITRWTAVPKYTIDHRRSSTNQHPCFYQSDLYYFHRFYVRTIITFRYYVELKLFYFVLWSVCTEGGGDFSDVYRSTTRRRNIHFRIFVVKFYIFVWKKNKYSQNIHANDKFAQIAVFPGETEHLTWVGFLFTFAASACRQQCALWFLLSSGRQGKDISAPCITASLRWPQT